MNSGQLRNTIFSTPTKVDADIHGGGLFFWWTYHYRLVFGAYNHVEMYKIHEIECGKESSKEELLFTGEYRDADVGHYTADIELRHVKHKVEFRYGALLVGTTTLVCHGILDSEFAEKRSYVSELFLLNKKFD